MSTRRRTRRWMGALLAGALLSTAAPASASAIDDGKGPRPACGPMTVPIIDSNGNVTCVPRCPSGTLPMFFLGFLICVPIASPTFPDPGPIA